MIAYIYFFHDQFNAALIVNGLPSGIFGRELELEASRYECS